MVDVLAQRCLSLLVVIWAILSVACVFLLTLGTDEAWVLNGLRSCQEQATAHVSSELVITNGGLFSVVNLGLEVVFGSCVWVHRFFSLTCLVLLVATASRASRAGSVPITTRWLVVAPLLGLPGTAEVGTAALGTSTAVLLLVIAAQLWYRPSEPSLGKIVLCGCLLGLGAASRFELCLFAPAMLVVSCIRPGFLRQPKHWLPRGEVAVILIAMGVFMANIFIMRWAMREIVEQMDLMNTTGASSLIKFADYPRTLNKALIGQGFAPLGLLVVASLLPFWTRYSISEQHRDGSRFTLFLIVTGWTLWCGWFFQAPIAHLRYLWPSLACFAIAAGHGLSELYLQARDTCRPFQSVSILLIACGLVAGGTAATFRSAVMGECNYVSWEWSREMPADYFRRFQHVQDQRAAMDFIEGLPKDEMIVCYGQPYICRYLTHRPVIELDDYLELSPPRPQTAHLLIPPTIGTYLYLPPEAFNWIEANCKLEAQFGRYSVYELPERMPQNAQFLSSTRSNYVRHPLSTSWWDWDRLYPNSGRQSSSTESP